MRMSRTKLDGPDDSTGAAPESLANEFICLSSLLYTSIIKIGVDQGSLHSVLLVICENRLYIEVEEHGEENQRFLRLWMGAGDGQVLIGDEDFQPPG